MNLETIKYALFFIPVALLPLAENVAQVVIEPGFQSIVENGGQVLPIALLIYGLKYMKGRLDKKEKDLEKLLAEYSKEMKQSVESRVVLANSIDKQAEAIDKMANIIEKLEK